MKKWRFLAILAILGPILAPIGQFFRENQPNFFKPDTFVSRFFMPQILTKTILFFFYQIFSPLKSANYSEKMAILAILAILGPILAPIGRFFWENQPNFFKPETFFLGFYAMNLTKNFVGKFFVKKIFSPLKSANYSEKMAIFGHFGHFGAILAPIGRFFRQDSAISNLILFFWVFYAINLTKTILSENFFVKKLFSPLKSANYSEKMAIFGHFGHFGANFGTNWPIFLGNQPNFFKI